MNLPDFSIESWRTRTTPAHDEELTIFHSIIDRSGLIQRLPSHNQLRIEVCDAVPAGTKLAAG
ncbi:MAG TPA: hypothetical protein VLI90_04250, partial [Tepidisphaeraceae bacterium]|nr:hypothetical protein [Tepidisphaeraceae bacterium]